MPAYRAFGALLVSRAFRHKVTYTNITPAPHSLPILEAQGYRRYCSGRVIAMPMFASRGGDAVVRAFDETRDAAGHLDPTEYQILKDHASYGCICLVCEKGGKTVPFVFAPRKRMLALRFAVLVYGSAAGEFLDFAQALGRYLARQKLPFVVIDANGPMPGACGIYFSRKPKFFRGPDRPRLNDHAYTERALFGS
ncbi:MAG: hypothetical protein P4L76_00015 [Beijerinckiaceae bacterium]|nr:hypothetical protein [Beijerinckiaceae bacterium]